MNLQFSPTLTLAKNERETGYPQEGGNELMATQGHMGPGS